MHFVGMLAVRLPFQVDYLVLPTLLSFLVCAIVVGGAVYATSSGPLTLLRLTLSSCLMGGGIFAMHYLGMSALHASTHMIHNPVYVAASMAIAIAASGLALWLATGRAWRAPLILSAAAFGMAISGMHYTAMTGVTLYPFVTAASAAPALSTDLLAIVVAVVAFCVSGIFFLLLLPDSARVEPQGLAVATAGPAAQAGDAAVAALPAAAQQGMFPDVPQNAGGMRPFTLITRPGSFFDPLPMQADLYLLKNVLNDWPDQETVAILRNCARAAKATGAIAVLGGVAPDDAPRSLGIDMLVAGGKTSTITQFTELARQAGLGITAARTQASGRYVVECRPQRDREHT